MCSSRGAPVLGGRVRADLRPNPRLRVLVRPLYRGERFRAQVCVTCGVELIGCSARRYRLGHIELPRPFGLSRCAL